MSDDSGFSSSADDMRTGHRERLSVLFVDNFDSFSFNLVDEFARRGCRVDVWRNDLGLDQALALVDQLDGPRLVVLSPGPGRPGQAGVCLPLIEALDGRVPLFGVCLGHQAIVEAYGGTVGHAEAVVHGKADRISHAADGVLGGLPSPMAVGRYHSLAAHTLPDCLEPCARRVDGGELVMAVRHRHQPVFGVQFHPESILTPLGGLLVDRVIGWAREAAK